MTDVIRSDKYTDVFMLGCDCVGAFKPWKSEVLNDKILSVSFLKFDEGDKMVTLAGAGVGGIVGGVVGALVGATVMKPKRDLIADIHLRDGSTIRIRTKKHNLINFLWGYMGGDDYGY